MEEIHDVHIGRTSHEAVVDFDLNRRVTKCGKDIDVHQIPEYDRYPDIITDLMNNNMCDFCFYDVIYQDVTYDATGSCQNMASVSSVRRYRKSRRTYLSSTCFIHNYLSEYQLSLKKIFLP